MVEKKKIPVRFQKAFKFQPVRGGILFHGVQEGTYGKQAVRVKCGWIVFRRRTNQNFSADRILQLFLEKADPLVHRKKGNAFFLEHSFNRPLGGHPDFSPCGPVKHFIGQFRCFQGTCLYHGPHHVVSCGVVRLGLITESGRDG